VTDYLTVAEVLAIHADQIETRRRFPWRQRPGAAGSRPLPAADRLFTPEAAALWESRLSQNHAFIDGNRRRSFAAMGDRCR
jgi:death-on-curing protein